MIAKLRGIAGLVVTVFLFLSLLSAYIRPNAYDILVLFGLVFPYLYLLGLFVLPWLWKKNKVNFAFLALLIVFGTKGFSNYVKLPISKDADPSDIQILTTNAMMGVKLVNEKHTFGASEQKAFDELMHRSPQPDIICGQEVNPIVDKALRASFAYEYYHKLDKRGSIILSQHPIVNKGLVDFGAKLNSCLWADIKIGADTIRVYSAHLESNRLSQETYDFLAKEGYDSMGAINGIRDLLGKYPRYASARADQALMIAAHIKKSPHPVILAGDFNEPPMSYTYRALRKVLQDSFLDNGSGWGTTWIGGVPLLRIDYILYSPELMNTSFHCLKTNLTDHYPVKASFKINHKE